MLRQKSIFRLRQNFKQHNNTQVFCTRQYKHCYSMDEPSGASKSIDDVINDFGLGRFQAVVIILCGLVQASDMLEIQYVSMMSQKLQCVWWISDYWKTFISSGTFLGLFVGSLLWGPLGDKHCRRLITAVCMGFIFFYGCLTAAAPNVVWVVILRFLVGTGIGGVQPLTSAMVSEFMPNQTRGLGWFLFGSLWCVGGVLEIGFAWALLELPHGWRYLAVVTAIPVLILGIPWVLWMPSSPRQSLLQGRMAETRKTLDRMADMNQKSRYEVDFDITDLQGKYKRGSLIELLRPNTYLRQTLQIALIFFASGFSYYGIILLNVQVPLLLRDRCYEGNSTVIRDWIRGLDRTCHSCATFNYVELLIPNFADLGTSLVNGLVIERLIGRRIIMAISFGLAAVLTPILSVCMPTAARIALFFIIRFLVSTGYSVVGLYSLEVYPTTLRSTAAGFHCSFSRIASILAPFIAQVFIVRVSLLGGLFIFSILLVGATISAALLPLETKGQPLPQTVVSALVAQRTDTEDEKKSNLGEEKPVLKRRESKIDAQYGTMPDKAD